MEGIFISGIVFFFVYKIVELAVRQKERRLMVEKMTEISPEMLQTNINSMKSIQNDSLISIKFLPLRWGALVLGVGTGWLLGEIIYLILRNNVEYYMHYNSAIISLTAICAGVALIIVYLIERKLVKEAKSGE
jgi:hypothetical protein